MKKHKSVFKRHDSQRGWFAYELYKEMERDDSIRLICIDLGYKVYDQHRKDFENQVIVTGASEQAAMGMAVGMAMSGLKPFVYSITPFLLWRPAETLRIYVGHERIPVRLVGSGRDDDYAHDGFSHNASDIPALLSLLNIDSYFPERKKEIPPFVELMVDLDEPQFISLKR